MLNWRLSDGLIENLRTLLSDASKVMNGGMLVTAYVKVDRRLDGWIAAGGCVNEAVCSFSM